MNITEKPILFSAPMVRAILDGTKTMTRRVVKRNASGRVALYGKQWHVDDKNAINACPYGVAGDRLWVREAWTLGFGYDGDENDSWAEVCYRADGEQYAPVRHSVSQSIAIKHIDGFERLEAVGDGGSNWKPSIVMPRWASRINLEILNVKIERLQEISEADALKEGIQLIHRSKHIGQDLYGIEGKPMAPSAYTAFAYLWDSINAKRCPWSSNPFVWAIEFKKL